MVPVVERLEEERVPLSMPHWKSWIYVRGFEILVDFLIVRGAGWLGVAGWLECLGDRCSVGLLWSRGNIHG